MTEDRAKRLNEIGFKWSTKDPRHVPWEERYKELGEFKVRLFGLVAAAAVGCFAGPHPINLVVSH